MHFQIWKLTALNLAWLWVNIKAAGDTSGSLLCILKKCLHEIQWLHGVKLNLCATHYS